MKPWLLKVDDASGGAAAAVQQCAAVSEIVINTFSSSKSNIAMETETKGEASEVNNREMCSTAVRSLVAATQHHYKQMRAHIKWNGCIHRKLYGTANGKEASERRADVLAYALLWRVGGQIS